MRFFGVLAVIVAVVFANCGGDTGTPCGEPTSYDFIIVGSSAAAGVVSHRLAEAGARVFLVEAAAEDSSLSSIPLASTETTVDGDIGVYVRGHRLDYDEWESKHNATGWGWRDVKPFFLKSEHMQTPKLNNPLYHGIEGPLPVTAHGFLHGASARFVKAAAEFGIPRTEDYNGAQHQGVAPLQVFQKNGRRVTVNQAFIEPAKSKYGANFTVSTSRVQKLLFDAEDHTSVVGVSFLDAAGQEQSVRAKQVILSAGALRTAELLLKNGIGPQAYLAQAGIKVRADSPQVGQNLQSHPTVVLRYGLRHPITKLATGALNNELCAPRSGVSLNNVAKWLKDGSGPLSSALYEAGAFVMSGESEDLGFRPDVAFTVVPSEAGSEAGMSIIVSLLHPRSRGSVTLSEVNYNAFHDERDLKALTQGIKIAHMITRQPAFLDVQPTLIHPEGFPAERNSAFWTDLARSAFDHYLGVSSTAVIGLKREAGVVDAKLRVHGVRNLRVVDASVFPTIPGGIGAAPVIAIAERAAEIMRREFKGLPDLDVSTIAGGDVPPGQVAGSTFPPAKPPPKKRK